MSKRIFDQVYDLIVPSKNMGICHVTTDHNSTISKTIHVNGNIYSNFTLCDYLALSQDERLKEAAIEAINNYGVYTSVSKSCVKLKIYEEAEDYASKIFNKPVLLFSRTTMAHIGILPVIIDDNDAVLIDHQAHTSMRLTTEMLKGNGIYVETVRHNRIDLLEERVKELKNKYSKIWYLADSVYSMYGDTLDYAGIKQLLDNYEQFHFYVDDAHGMSWTGKNGSGYLLEQMEYTEKMVLITSLGKGFGAGGGAVICYDKKMRDKIEICATSLLFTLPLTPANLAAIIEASKIHISKEIYGIQKELKEKISLFYSKAISYNLPLLNDPQTPIAFIATGKPDMCRDVSVGLKNRGVYISISHFPLVPVNNSGIRATISLYQSNDDIINFVDILKEEYDKALKARKLNVNDILKHYKVEKQMV